MSSRPLDPEDVDAAFAEIVRHLDDDLGTASERSEDGPRTDEQGRVLGPPRSAINPPFRARPGTGPHPPEPDDEAAPPSPVPWRTDPTMSVADALLSSDDDVDEADEFVPPPTAPLPPTSDRTFWLALVGLVGGPLLVLWSVFTGGGMSWTAWLGFALVLAGFAALVLRQPTERDGLDEGARV